MKKKFRMKWWKWILVAFAIIYIALPVDLIPDFAPILGWLDDIMVTIFSLIGIFLWDRK